MVRYAAHIEWKGSVEGLLQAKGGINGCVEKESEERKPAKANGKHPFGSSVRKSAAPNGRPAVPVKRKYKFGSVRR